MRDETTNRELRCYNCNTTEHIKNDCPNPSRSWRSCYWCDNAEHRANNCTSESASTSSRAARTPEATSIRLIQPSSPQEALAVPVSFVTGGNHGRRRQIETVAMLDSGSPVSLIKESVLGGEYYERVPLNSDYYEVNGSRLQAKVIFEQTVKGIHVSVDCQRDSLSDLNHIESLDLGTINALTRSD